MGVQGSPWLKVALIDVAVLSIFNFNVGSGRFTHLCRTHQGTAIELQTAQATEQSISSYNTCRGALHSGSRCALVRACKSQRALLASCAARTGRPCACRALALVHLPVRFLAVAAVYCCSAPADGAAFEGVARRLHGPAAGIAAEDVVALDCSLPSSLDQVAHNIADGGAHAQPVQNVCQSFHIKWAGALAYLQHVLARDTLHLTGYDGIMSALYDMAIVGSAAGVGGHDGDRTLSSIADQAYGKPMHSGKVRPAAVVCMPVWRAHIRAAQARGEDCHTAGRVAHLSFLV